MARAYIGLLVACTLLCGASAFEWHTCAEGKADVSHVALSPDPPQAGDTISFSIDAESSKLLLHTCPHCTSVRTWYMLTTVALTAQHHGICSTILVEFCVCLQKLLSPRDRLLLLLHFEAFLSTLRLRTSVKEQRALSKRVL
jgi:hypothetical protein